MNGNVWNGIISKKLQLTLFFATPIVLSLLTPVLKDGVTSLYKSTSGTPAYEGDGILIGDSGTSIPFTSIHWSVRQRPMLGDRYHAVSIYAVPEVLARQSLFPFRSFFSTGNQTIRVRKEETHSTGARVYVYLLPQMYLQPDQETIVNINVEVLSDFHTEVLPAPLFRFDTREAFSNFVDFEPGSEGNAVGCSCMLGDITQRACSKNDRNCIEQQTIISSCLKSDLCSTKSVHTSRKSSYNFITTVVPENSTVRYSAELLMYFYNTEALKKYYVCTIRENDTCSFDTNGSFKLSKSWDERHLIIAFTHPTTIPSSLTTFLIIEAETTFTCLGLLLLLLFLVLYLVYCHCFQSVFIKYCKKDR